MGIARFRVSLELFGDLIRLPSNCKIVNIATDWHTDAIEIIVTSPDLPEQKEGRLPDLVTPLFVMAEDGIARFEKWGISQN